MSRATFQNLHSHNNIIYVPVVSEKKYTIWYETFKTAVDYLPITFHGVNPRLPKGGGVVVTTTLKDYFPAH